MTTVLPDITTNSPDVPEDKMSPAEMNVWSIDAMKEFCCLRDFKVSSAKKEQAARVYILYNCGAEGKPSAKKIRGNRRKNDKSLLNSDHRTRVRLKLYE